MVLPITSLALLLVACNGQHTSDKAQVIPVASDSEQGITGRIYIGQRGTYYWNKVKNQLSMETIVDAQSQADEKTSEGQVHKGRTDRAIISFTGWVLRQWKRIISDAKLEASVGNYEVHLKNGGYNRALADFRSLRPTNVENHLSNPALHLKTGDAGNMHVSLLQQRVAGSASTDEDIILFLDGPENQYRAVRYID